MLVIEGKSTLICVNVDSVPLREQLLLMLKITPVLFLL